MIINPIVLANELESKYPELKFRNHCYLRIAYDNTVNAKWDIIVKKPFTLQATKLQLFKANKLLKLYLIDIDLLLKHNKISLKYRNKQYSNNINT